MRVSPYKYYLEYSILHIYFSYRQWLWIMNFYTSNNRLDELERGYFWHYLGATPDKDYFRSEYCPKND